MTVKVHVMQLELRHPDSEETDILSRCVLSGRVYCSWTHPVEVPVLYEYTSVSKPTRQPWAIADNLKETASWFESQLFKWVLDSFEWSAISTGRAKLLRLLLSKDALGWWIHSDVDLPAPGGLDLIRMSSWI